MRSGNAARTAAACDASKSEGTAAAAPIGTRPCRGDVHQLNHQRQLRGKRCRNAAIAGFVGYNPQVMRGPAGYCADVHRAHRTESLSGPPRHDGARVTSSTLLEQFQTTSALSGGNAAFIEELYELWLQDPAGVAPTWNAYFASLKGRSDGRSCPFRRDCSHRSGPAQRSEAPGGAGDSGRQRRGAETGGRAQAGHRLSVARPSRGQSRSARSGQHLRQGRARGARPAAASGGARSRTRLPRPVERRPRHRIQYRLALRPAAAQAARPDRPAQGDLCEHDRRRVHAYLRRQPAPVDAREAGRRRRQVRPERGREEAPARQADPGRWPRALPAYEIRRPEALRARRRRQPDSDARRDAAPRRQRRAQGHGHRHGPSRPPQCARQHPRQAAVETVRRIRGRASSTPKTRPIPATSSTTWASAPMCARPGAPCMSPSPSIPRIWKSSIRSWPVRCARARPIATTASASMSCRS